MAAGRYADAPPSRGDDWSALAIPAVPPGTLDAACGMGGGDEGGPRHQPELSEAAVYDPGLSQPTTDLGLLDDDDPLPALPSRIDPALQRTSRLAALDPDDGIAL